MAAHHFTQRSFDQLLNVDLDGPLESLEHLNAA